MKNSWDNTYNGMNVPDGHGSIFRGMDEDARLSKICQENNRKAAEREKLQKESAKQALLRAQELAQKTEIDKKAEEDMQEQMELESQKSISPPFSEIAQSKVGSDEVPLDGQPKAFAGLSDIETVQSQPIEAPEPQAPAMSMKEMMARMKEMEALITEKDEKIDNMVSQEQVEEIVADIKQEVHDTKTELTTAQEESAAKSDIMREKDKVISEKDKILEVSNMQVEMQKQMLTMKDTQIEALTQDKSKLDVDKSDLKLEVKELKEELVKSKYDQDNSGYMPKIEDTSDYSDLGKPKSDKGSIGKTSNSSVLRQVVKEKDCEIQDLKDMLAAQSTQQEFSSTTQMNEAQTEFLGDSSALETSELN